MSKIYAASLEVCVCPACNVLNSLKAPDQSSSARHIKVAKAHVSSKPCAQQHQLQAHGQSPSAMRNTQSVMCLASSNLHNPNNACITVKEVWHVGGHVHAHT